MKTVMTFAWLVAALVMFCRVAAATTPPNVIVVLCDDLGIGDIGPYGATRIKSPHLDRMAREGAVLTSFYSSASVCTPSRGGLLTGRYPNRLGITADVARPTNDIGIKPDEVTLAEALKAEGYATAHVGKWHLGHREHEWPTANGFDYYYGLPYSNDMKPLALYRMSEAVEDPVDQTTLTERYTAESVAFIERHRDKPFFLYLAHSMPHVPLFVSEKFEGRSDAGRYGDVVETIDWGMGELFAALERLGIDDNTVVLFTSDNGPWWEGSSGAYRDRKGSAWEGGMRVPLLARWPGHIPEGSKSDAISMNIDLFPTVVKLAGAELPNDRIIDGRDIMPVLKGAAQSPHEYLVFFNQTNVNAVRSQKWKLVVRSWYRRWNAHLGAESYYYHPGMLFDMTRTDPEIYSEAREHPEIANQMREWLDQAEKEIIPTPDTKPD